MQRYDPKRVEDWHQALLLRYKSSEHYLSRYTQQSKDNYMAVLDFLAWFEGEKVRHSVLKEQFVVRSESTNRRLRVVAETVIPGKPMTHRPVPPEKRMYVHQLSVILAGLIEAGFVERCEERPATLNGEERQRPQVFFKVAVSQMRELSDPIPSPARVDRHVPEQNDLSFWNAIRERLREIDLDSSAVDDATFSATMEEIARAITISGRKLLTAKERTTEVRK
ncbi:MAG: hypothetical protein SA339_13770 [Methanomassiliicoccus sp.]|nr:hypothetical protein [Methanomassiliicoccus sp.]